MLESITTFFNRQVERRQQRIYDPFGLSDPSQLTTKHDILVEIGRTARSAIGQDLKVQYPLAKRLGVLTEKLSQPLTNR